MPITKVGKKYKVKVYHYVGRKCIRKQALCDTRTEAKQREQDLMTELQTQTESSLTASQLVISTFGDAVILYIHHLHMTGRNNKDHLRRYDLIKRLFGASILEEVPHQLYTWMQGSFNERSNATINRITTMIRAVYNHLLKLEIIHKNPITRIRFPKLVEKPRDRILEPKDRDRLFAVIKANFPDYYPFFYFQLIIPSRTSELVNARREHYDPVNNVITVPDSKAKIPIIKMIPPEMIGYFENLPTDTPYLFYRKRGKTYYPLTNYRRAWERSLQLCGLSDLRVHDLRHLSSTALYNMGVAERVIMSVAGWKTPMLSTYRHKDGIRDAQTAYTALLAQGTTLF